MPLTQETFKDSGEQKPRIAEGWYIANMKSASREEGKEFPYYKIEFELPSKTEAGKTHTHFENFSTAPDKKNPNARGYGLVRFGNVASCVGAITSDGKISTEDLVGKPIGVCFRHQEREDQYGMNKTQAGITEFRKAEEVQARINYLAEHGRELG